MKVEATSVGVHSYCLQHFLKSGAKCPGDMNLKQFSNLFQLYEHHTNLIGWTWTTSLYSMLPSIKYLLGFFFLLFLLFFPRHNVYTLLAP